MRYPVNSVEYLIAELALSNNGRLFSPSAEELAVAHANPARFIVRAGVIYAGRAPRPSRPDGPDYEGMILNRQEAAFGDY